MKINFGKQKCQATLAGQTIQLFDFKIGDAQVHVVHSWQAQGKAAACAEGRLMLMMLVFGTMADVKMLGLTGWEWPFVCLEGLML